MRKPLFLIVDSDNSFAFQHVHQYFGQPFVVLMSPQDVPERFRGKSGIFMHSKLTHHNKNCRGIINIWILLAIKCNTLKIIKTLSFFLEILPWINLFIFHIIEANQFRLDTYDLFYTKLSEYFCFQNRNNLNLQRKKTKEKTKFFFNLLSINFIINFI